MAVLSSEKITEFRRAVLDNFHQAGRDFPWRNTHDPYKILVSEMMLQQTQTLRVLPKYEAWLNQFPTAESLASASLSEVLAAWSGLGYNRRARFLQQSCQTVCTEYNGIFPKTAEELERLPGIGPYTARAVAAFAFNSPEVFVETNIRSVFIFFFFKHAVEKVSDKEILPLVDETLYKENPRIWYYALMDYGAELKKKVKNPSRKSAGYAKQSKFEGSLRQARGAVLRQLTKNKASTIESIAEAEHIDVYRIKKAADQLCKELLICEHNALYEIKN